MLDAKILAAVFTALTAVAVTTGGGTVDKSDMNGLNLEKTEGLPSIDILDGLKKLIRNRPEPENDIEANLTVEDLEEKAIKLEKADIRIPGLRGIHLSDKNLTSDEEIDLNSFEGKISFGNKTLIKGSAETITTSGVNMSGSSKIDHKTEKNTLRLENVEKVSLSYNKVTGSIKTDSATTNIDNSREIKLTSFSGNITIAPENRTMFLEGKVHEMKSGEFKFGG